MVAVVAVEIKFQATAVGYTIIFLSYTKEQEIIMETKLTSTEVNRLVQTLGEDSAKDKYYVYALCFSDSMPFYIGKGQGRRVLDHFENALDAQKYIEADETLTEEERMRRVAALSTKLQTLLKEGTEYKPVIIKWGLTEHEAFMCESALINMYGFSSNILTNIVNGHASKKEKASVSDVKTKARTVGLFLRECAISSKPIESIIGKGDHFLFINIHKLYESCLNEEGIADRELIKEVVRGFWRIGLKCAKTVNYIFALYRQRVVGVFHVKRPPKSLADERKDKFPGFPYFPEEIRRIDRLKACAKNLDEAKMMLSPSEYDELCANLRDTNEDVRSEYKKFQSRVYFEVDDEVPPEIKAFENTFPTENGSTDFVRKGVIQYGRPVYR